MARTGRPRKPTHLKLLEGTFRKDRAPKREPKAPRGRPSPPAYLGRVAKATWRRVIRDLESMRILSAVDRDIIAAYCQAVQRYQEFERAITEHGITFVTEKGYVAQRPEVAMAHKQAQLVKQLAGELGLTPAARSRIDVPEKEPPKDQTEEMLFGKRRGA